MLINLIRITLTAIVTTLAHIGKAVLKILEVIVDAVIHISNMSIFTVLPFILIVFVLNALYPSFRDIVVTPAVPLEDPYIMYDKIKAQVPFLKDLPIPLVITDDGTINAYTDYRSVVLHRGLLEYVTSNDELAFIIGHELGHMYDYYVLKKDIRGPKGEERADTIGIKIANKAGYNACKGSELFFRIYNDYGDSRPVTHPVRTTRMMYLACNKANQNWDIKFPETFEDGL